MPERLDRQGRVLLALDEAAVRALAPISKTPGSRKHRRRLSAWLRRSETRAPDSGDPGEERLRVPISLASEVSPEMREYERFSTTVANAYVQPLMTRYLRGLERDLLEMRSLAPILMMLSGGNLTTIDTACFPIRLVESGPASSHILGERRPRKRAGTGAFVRHGRNHGQGLADRRLCAAGSIAFRGGSGRPLQEGLGPAAADSRHRYGRDRPPARSLAGLDALGRIAVGAGKRGGRSGTRQLRHGRRTAGGHRREFAARGRYDPERFAGSGLVARRVGSREDGPSSAAVGRPLGLGDRAWRSPRRDRNGRREHGERRPRPRRPDPARRAKGAP